MTVEEKRKELKKLAPPGDVIDTWSDEVVNGRYGLLEEKSVDELIKKRRKRSEDLEDADEGFF